MTDEELQMFGWFRKKKSDDDVDTNRALEYFSRGDFREALRRADVILSVTPNLGLSWRFKGECLFSLNRLDEAIVCFDRAAEIGGEGTEDMFLWKALCLANSGKMEPARQVIRGYLASGVGSEEMIAKAQGALAKFEEQA